MSKLQSTAVMARRVEPDDSLEYFPTPPWATRALVEYVLRPAIRHNDRSRAGTLLHDVCPATKGGNDSQNCTLSEANRKILVILTALDPACGEGHMAMVLGEYFGHVEAGDIFDYGYGAVADFLHPDYLPRAPIDWVITNPPFNCAVEFIHQAREIARYGVAMLVRVQFNEGIKRYRNLFKHDPPSRTAFFVERVPMHRGRWVVNGKSATMYCWLVWQSGEYPQAPIYIPPCCRQLTRHDDWLKFGGCVDVPKKHAAAEMLVRLEKDQASSTAYPLKWKTLQKVLALRGQA